ncbi:MAG TPA: serine hydrolase domain-containing protein [Longimicrobiales bacterium]|nr:serine hydrolase domain-containing protein [Longimicrobiales bacterium]
MRAFAVLVTLALLVALPARPAAGQAGGEVNAATAERIARIESSLIMPLQLEGRPVEQYTIRERMAHWGVPGVSVAVIDGGEVAWTKAWGVKDVDTGDPVTPTTLFQAASISKPVAVMGMLRLVEAGRLGLDEPVGSYLSSWAVPDHEFDEPVTLRRLASHTAGTNVHGFPGYARSAERPTTAGVLRGEGNTDAVVVEMEPGSRHRYSGGGTTILQLVVEDVTGQPFEDYMAGAVLGPVGMTRSTFAQPLPEDRWDDAAAGHRSDGARVEGHWHSYPEKAAAGLWTTPADLARLAVEVQRSLRGESNAVLSRRMTRTMLEPVQSEYGLGFGTEPDIGRFGHGGANAGFRATLVAFRDGRGLAIMTNSDEGGAIAQELMMAIARAYGWDEIAPPTLAVAELTAEQRDAIAGTWVMRGLPGRVTLTPTDDGLFRLESTIMRPTTYVPVSTERLVPLAPAPVIEVVWEDGRVVRLRAQGRELVRAEAR